LFLAILLAFGSLLVSGVALAQSKEEYTAQVEAAEARISAAQEALQRAQTAYDSALATEVSLNSQIAQAGQTLQAAQAAYDQSLIPDPSWQRPTVEEAYTVEVPYTIQVPYVVQEPETIQVATTSIIETTAVVPTTTYTMIGGIRADVFNRLGYNAAPPLPSSSETPYATSTVSQIDFQWGGGFVMDTNLHEDVIVRFTGNLMVPADGNYQFFAPADDGVILNIAGMGLINDWYDKGGGGSISQAVWIRAGILYPFTLYYYENGGGAWVQFYAKEISSPVNWQVVPESWLGSQPQATTTYETVTTYTEVITYSDQIIYNDVTYYRDETAYRQEERTRTVPDANAMQPMIKDASLLSAITDAQNNLNSLSASRIQNSGIIESTSNDVTTKQEELRVSQQELEAIPPFREPTPTPSETESTPEEPTEPEPEPLPEPEQTETPEPESESELLEQEAVAEIETLAEIDPKELTEAQAEQLTAAAMVVFETAERGSEAYNQALEALAIVAVADDPKLPEELAAIPGAAAVLETFNALGNVGADMSPQVRKEAEQTVVASVIAVGAAVSAASTATLAAASAPAASGGTIRKVN
jgi:hypothetical protein